jgi:hypothetical protein
MCTSFLIDAIILGQLLNYYPVKMANSNDGTILSHTVPSFILSFLYGSQPILYMNLITRRGVYALVYFTYHFILICLTISL